MGRVKFYSTKDLTVGTCIERIKVAIEALENKKNYDLIDILEYFNILKFYKNSLYPKDFTDEKIKISQNELNRIISTYFNKLEKQEIINSFKILFSSMDKGIQCQNDENSDLLTFKEDFLECFDRYKLYKKISEEDMQRMIDDFQVNIYYLLKFKIFSLIYPEMIKNYIFKDSRSFEFVLDNYTQRDFINKTSKSKYFLPNNISKGEYYSLCEDYLESDIANPNYIKLIENGIQGFQEFDINPKLKLKAKKRREQIESSYFDKNQNKNFSVSPRVIAAYSKKSDYDSAGDNEIKNFVDAEYIKQHDSPADFLEYIMYMDHFFSDNWILELCSFLNIDCGTLERVFLLGARTKNYYNQGHYFFQKNILMIYSFQLFQDILKRDHNLGFEDLIKWFFEDYCKNDFNIKWLPMRFAKDSEDSQIKIGNLFIIEEQIRKQWKLLIEDNKIDEELFRLESTPSIGSLKSKLKNKYIYVNNDNPVAEKIIYILFSDQSPLKYINENFKDESLINLLRNNKLKRDSFSDFQIDDIDLLANNHILSFDKDGYIYFTPDQNIRIMVLCTLFHYGVVHYYNLCFCKISSLENINAQKNEINKMIDEGLLISENTLFSKPESDYLNYIINNSSFDNSMGLRNKYLHGSEIEGSDEDLIYTWIILIVYVIKINEELVLSNNSNSDI